MDILLTVILAAGLPALLYSAAIWLLDKYEREPGVLLLVTFGWGAVPAVVVSLVLEILFELPLGLLLDAETSAAISAVLAAPLVEELAKGFVLWLVFLTYRKEFDGVLDGIVYASLIGFGFAMSENFVAYLSVYAEGGSEALRLTVFFRAILFGLDHALYTSVSGLGFGYASLAPRGRGWLRWLAPLLGTAGAVAAHMFHNLAVVKWGSLGVLVSLVVSWGGLLLFLSIVFLTWRREAHWLRTQLGEETWSGLLSANELEALTSWRRRLAAQLWALFRSGPGPALRVQRRQERLTRLAFLKHRQAATGTDTRGEAERLRAAIRGTPV